MTRSVQQSTARKQLGSPSIRSTPQFISGPAGALLLTEYRPEGLSVPDHWVLHFPAFADEMNKSRRMVSEQARAFSRSGLGVAVLDLYGTGDSSGNFSDADWDTWKADIVALTLYLRAQGVKKVSLWGLRLGCLLALDVLEEIAESMEVDRLIFWQPVVSGQTFMNQFLRLRVAAGFMSGEAETVAGLRERLTRGESLEVAGYPLSPALVGSIDALSLKASPPEGVAVHWLEVVASPRRPLMPQSCQVVDTWEQGGLLISTATVTGSSFWATQEISSVPTLISATCGGFDELKVLGVETGSEAGQEVPAAVYQSADPPVVETPLTFNCRDDKLVGILHPVALSETRNRAARGVLLVVGGPQYRVGSHRQFVLLARALAAAGIPVFRFDYRGMGDSEGETVCFDAIDEDIECALECFLQAQPEIEDVILWGLCDGATAACFFAPVHPRITGLVLLNPWLHSEEGEGRTYLKHYYLKRLLSPALWKKIRRGEFKLWTSLGSLLGMLVRLFCKFFLKLFNALLEALVWGWPGDDEDPRSCKGTSLVERMQQSLHDFDGRVLLLLSGNDLTAAEFSDVVKASRGFRILLEDPRFTRQALPEADHTFSRRRWSDQVSSWTIEWLKSL